MTNRAEFERLLDVYGFRCERFGQDLSTHARAQVVSAFAALASATVAKPKRAPLDDWRVQAIAECLEAEWDDMTPDQAEADARLIVGYLIEYEKESDRIEAKHAAEPVEPIVQAIRNLRASAPVAGEALTRFCPECSHVGDVGSGYRSCCPDGGSARMVPKSLADKCRATFQLAIKSDAAPQASEAYTYARNLAVTMWEKRFKQDAPEWKPCEDLIGVLTQIDNMVARLVVPQASEANDLIDALGQCRDAFPIPDKVGSKLDLLWQEAMSDPTAVPEYVKLCAALSAQPGAQKEQT